MTALAAFYTGFAGMLAGEGLGGVFQALLAVAKVDGGSGYGTAIGCPAFEFCG